MHHRIHSAQLPAEGGVEIAGEEFHHAVRVARVREGEEVELFDGRGSAMSGRVESIGRDSLTVRIDRPIDSREAKLDLTIAMSIIQLERFELVLQKVTELGASTIIPVVADRVEVRPERYRGKHDRWEKIVFEAVKQSGRSRIPELRPPMRFDEVIALDGLRILFDADEAPAPLPDHIDRVILLIGPEGGWSERELRAAKEAGCIFQRLGSRRLRAETAAIVAAATVTARSGELD